MSEAVCTVGEVSFAAREHFQSQKEVIAAEGMAAFAATAMTKEAVCGGNWKKRRKTVERQLKMAAREELKTQLGIGVLGMWFLGWLIQRVFTWFVERYFEGE